MNEAATRKQQRRRHAERLAAEIRNDRMRRNGGLAPALRDSSLLEARLRLIMSQRIAGDSHLGTTGCGRDERQMTTSAMTMVRTHEATKRMSESGPIGGWPVTM